MGDSGLLSINGRNKDTPNRDAADASRNKKLKKVKEERNKLKADRNKVFRHWYSILDKFGGKKKNQSNIPLLVPTTDQATGEINHGLSSTAAVERQEHDSRSSSHYDQYQSATIAGGGDDSRKQKSAERGDYLNSTGYNIAGPSNEPTGAKRGLGHSQDASRLSTKRIKHDDHDLRENELIQLQKEFDRLTAELKTFKDEKAKAAQYMQQWETLQQEVQNTQMSYEAQVKELLMAKERAEQDTQANRYAINLFETKVKELQEDNLRVRAALQEKEGLLAEFRNDIVKLSNERPDSKRDDHYFEQHFAQLFRSIQDWVLQYYLRVKLTLGDSTSLHPLMQGFLQTTAGQDGLVLLRSEPIYTIQAYITSQMTSRVLRPFLLGLMEDSFERLYNIIAPFSDGEEVTKWRLSTIKMCTGREEFANEVSIKTGEIAAELVTSLAALWPDSTSSRYNPIPRTKKLKGILEQAAALALEVQQEPSTFTYTNIDPATICIASHVFDAKGLRSEDDLEASGIRVRLTVSPAVIRKPHNEAEEIVLVKAKVLTVESSDT